MRNWLVIAVCLTPLSLRAAVIDVRDRVTVAEGSLLRLQDIAKITEPDPVKAAALAGVTLGPAPAAGRSQRLSFEELRGRLQAYGVNLAELEFRGQQATTISTPSVTAPVVRPVRRETALPKPTTPPPTKLQRQQAEQLMQSAVQRAFRLTNSDELPVRVVCECELDDVPGILATSADRIRFAEPQVQVGPPQSVTAHWQTLAGEQKTAIVQVVVDLAPRRLAVRHAIPAGYPLQPDDLEWVTGEIDPQSVTQLADAVGKEARRTLRAGQMLTTDLLATSPLVRPNDIVTVQVRRPGVTVRRMFKALGQGGMNDVVSLVAVDDPRLRVTGVVTGYHEATIVEQSAPPPSAPSSPGGQP